MAWFKAPEGVASVHREDRAYEVVDGVFKVNHEGDEREFRELLGYEYGGAPEGYVDEEDNQEDGNGGDGNPNPDLVAQKEAELAAAQAALDADPENEELKKAVTKSKTALTKAKNAAQQ